MATVVSLTEQKIKELLNGWEGVALSQDQINALVIQLGISQETVNAEMEQITNTTLPQFEADLTANSNKVSELNDTIIPGLDAALANNEAVLQDLNTVVLPGLREELSNGVENALAMPQRYFQPEPPTGPDPEDPEDPNAPRELIINDVWYDTNDGYRQYRWDGVQWVVYSVDIPDLSITVKKFKTSTHMIY